MAADGGLLAFRTQPHAPYAAGGFRILHVSCREPDDAELATVRLEACLDRDGLSLLLGFLSAGPGRRPEPGLTVADVDEFVDLIRRLHVPFYEPARRRFGEPHVRRTMLRADRASPYQSPALRKLVQASG